MCLQEKIITKISILVKKCSVTGGKLNKSIFGNNIYPLNTEIINILTSPELLIYR